MNKTDYHQKCLELLNDDTTYKKLNSDPTNKYIRNITSVIKPLKDSGAITPSIYKRIYPTTTESPKLYGLPKIHKPAVPLRPIVSSRGSITYNLAKLVAQILSPLQGKTPHYIKNSKDLIDKLSNYTLTPDEKLVSYDVSALFANVPIEGSLEVIKKKLEADTDLHLRTSLNADQVTSLLKVCLTTTYFRYNNEYYIQTDGAAMGSPVSPIVANLYMEDFEEQALSSFPDPPRFWGRYVDDTMVIIKTAHIELFTQHINNISPKIKFTIETEESSRIPMLDTLIIRKEDGSLKFQVYRKKTHTDHYLQFNSHQPLEHKLGVIRTLTHRANTHVTEDEDKEEELNHIKKVLSISGYTKWAWELPGNKKISPHPAKSNHQKHLGHVTIPYLQGISEAICRKLRKAGITAHTRPHTSLRSLLCHLKDKEPGCSRCGVIYQIDCGDCETIHIRSYSPSLNRDQGRHTLPRIYDSLVQQSRDLQSRDITSSRDITPTSRDNNNTDSNADEVW